MTDRRIDVAIASCRPLPEPDPDQDLLHEAITRAGMSTACLPWNDPDSPFDQARIVVLRSTWDYPHRLRDFLSWADKLGGRILNPLSVIRWNCHKSYLEHLRTSGLRVVPTAHVRRGDATRLQAIVDAHGWNEVIIKPAVSAGSFETHRVAQARDAEQLFARLVGERDMMVQPFVSSVQTYGERAVVVIDDEVTHAVRKQVRLAGDHESVRMVADVSDDERRMAQAAMAVGRSKAEGALLYGRVDMARDDEGSLMVMELELIEPSLFLAQSQHALERMVRAIRRRLDETR